MFVNLRDRLYALWRAADERGTELDVLLQNRRDKSAAKRVFKSAPRSVETDSYAFR
ncbi:transposase [Mycetohabitans sp. B5]|uniref:DDE superfamily endonuclease n=2 Tax=Burkholderiaceae TaxID=119060 RepID=A0A2P5KBE2_9BURK|nr:transposase [Mycetohabitans sp. B5]PPB84011.1 DDE superfamily endonuclease [Mycetohabitans endofungorum]